MVKKGICIPSPCYSSAHFIWFVHSFMESLLSNYQCPGPWLGNRDTVPSLVLIVGMFEQRTIAICSAIETATLDEITYLTYIISQQHCKVDIPKPTARVKNAMTMPSPGCPRSHRSLRSLGGPGMGQMSFLRQYWKHLQNKASRRKKPKKNHVGAVWEWAHSCEVFWIKREPENDCYLSPKLGMGQSGLLA